MTGWRPLLRIARRDAVRSRGRSALIVAMVMIPVAGVTFIDVMLRTTQVSPQEQVAIRLGVDADVRLESSGSGNPIVQLPTDTYAYGSATRGSASSTTVPQEPTPPVDPATLLPPGSRWITDARDEVTARTTDGIARTTIRELDYQDPIAQGIVRQVSGRAPKSTAEVVATPALLDRLGLSVGDDVSLTRPVKTLTIVGSVRTFSPETPREAFIGLPGTVIGQTRPAGELPLGTHTVLADTPAPVSWSQVLAFNERGVAAFSRHVVANPPPREAVPYYSDPAHQHGQGRDLPLYLAIGLVVGLAVLEVSLLAGAAFAVGARRQRRALGLLAATGGSATHVRGVVLAQGAVLGAAGSVVGLGVGLVASYAVIAIANDWLRRSLLPADLHLPELLGLALLGIVTGLLAAAVPARAAARHDVVAALRGRAGITRTSRRVPAVGLGAAVVGGALATGGGALALAIARSGGELDSVASLAVVMLLGGSALTQLGLIVGMPAIVGAVGRLGRWLPLPPRLALRDAARNRARTAPAVAAILAAVTGTVAVLVFVSALSDHDRRDYRPAFARGQVALDVQPGPPDSFYAPDLMPNLARALSAVRDVAPPARTFPLHLLSQNSCDPTCVTVYVRAAPAKACPAEEIYREGRELTPAEGEEMSNDPRCTTEVPYPTGRYGGSGPVVGDYEDFVALTGIESRAAQDMLGRNGIVVLSERYVDNGTVRLEISRTDNTGKSVGRSRVVTLPAVYVRPGPGQHLIDSIVPPVVARSFDLTPVRVAEVLQYDALPSSDQEEEISDALSRLTGNEMLFEVERGYRDAYGAGLLALVAGSTVITLGAAAVATGLAQADGRPDHATLAAVGAAPRVRRSLAAWQAGAVATLGVALGTVCGLVTMSAYVLADTELELVMPWRELGVVTLVIPLLAASGGWLLTRSRLPLSRRLEA